MIGTIPPALQEDITELRRPDPVYDPDSGGQYVQQPAREIRFRGAILPLSTDDLRRAPQGTYTPNTRKLYTTHSLLPGSQIMAAGQTYTVSGILDYGSIHPLKRYTIERKGGTGYGHADAP